MKATTGSPRAVIDEATWYRKNPSPPERVVWEWLRARRMLGLKWRRQCPLGPYIVDFFCHELRTALEIDGTSHQQRTERDQSRDAAMRAAGIRVVRVEAQSILTQPEEFQTRLERYLQSVMVHPPPPDETKS